MRQRSLRYGISYLRSSEFKIPSVIKVNGDPKKLEFNKRDSPAFVYEFREICIEDCYRLKALGRQLKEIKTIVDIGANQGLFCLAARQFFPEAVITCYEPNYNLKKILDINSGALNVKYYPEAVTRQDCRVTLNFGDSDLHTVSAISDKGSVTGTAFSRLVERAGNSVDILKIDCEGAEWDLLEEKEAWKNIKAITMEYHLWARPGMTTEILSEKMRALGFSILSFSALSDSFGLLSAIREER